MKESIKMSIESKVFHFGIHTLEISHNGVAFAKSIETERCINSKFSRIYPHEGITREWIVLNPNRYYERYITTFSEFKNVLSQILHDLDIEEFKIIRVDFRIDDEEDTYEQLLKFNKLFALLYASKYKVNRYQSFDPLTLEGLAISINNNTFEIQNYNKNLQSDGCDDFQNRLELRTKRINFSSLDDIPEAFTFWKRSFSKTYIQFVQLQHLCNASLVKRWRGEAGNLVRSQSEFIRKYQENFFTRSQLIDYLETIQPEGDVKKRASNLVYENDIVLFKAENVLAYLNEIEKGITNFLIN